MYFADMNKSQKYLTLMRDLTSNLHGNTESTLSAGASWISSYTLSLFTTINKEKTIVEVKGIIQDFRNVVW